MYTAPTAPALEFSLARVRRTGKIGEMRCEVVEEEAGPIGVLTPGWFWSATLFAGGVRAGLPTLHSFREVGDAPVMSGPHARHTVNHRCAGDTCRWGRGVGTRLPNNAHELRDRRLGPGCQ